MNVGELENRIIKRYKCSRSDAQIISERAADLKAEVVSGQESGASQEINPDYIINGLEMAPEHLSAIEKWNWWAGMADHFSNLRRDYRID